MFYSRFFTPILAGATLRDRLIACVGGIAGISLTSLISWIFLPDSLALLFLVAPMGASAVLVFAVPASPLAQPWPVIGGNTLSALIGVACAQVIAIPHVAAGLAVGLAILGMSLTRSLHPPGGAAALTAVIGGQQVAAAGFEFAFLPVALNAVCLVIVGIVFHRGSGHSYPHKPQPVAGHFLT